MTQAGLRTALPANIELIPGPGCPSVFVPSKIFGLGIRITQENIPVHETVQSVCEILGYDTLFMACEGRAVAVIAEEQADEALSHWHTIYNGREACSIGRITSNVSRVVLETELGGEWVLEELEDDPLPRIY